MNIDLKTCKKCGSTKTSKWYFGPVCGSCYVTSNRKKRKDLDLNYHRYQRDFALQKKYNLTITQYEELFKQQSGLCRVCLQPDRTKRRSTTDGNLVVDHCHSTGKIRGLLCHGCNVALGSFKDSTDILLRAVAYLKASR